MIQKEENILSSHTQMVTKLPAKRRLSPSSGPVETCIDVFFFLQVKTPACPPLGVKKRGTEGLSARIRRSTNEQVDRKRHRRAFCQGCEVYQGTGTQEKTGELSVRILAYQKTGRQEKTGR